MTFSSLLQHTVGLLNYFLTVLIYYWQETSAARMRALLQPSLLCSWMITWVESQSSTENYRGLSQLPSPATSKEGSLTKYVHSWALLQHADLLITILDVYSSWTTSANVIIAFSSWRNIWLFKLSSCRRTVLCCAHSRKTNMVYILKQN